jgi:hypothetical protein
MRSATVGAAIGRGVVEVAEVMSRDPLLRAESGDCSDGVTPGRGSLAGTLPSGDYIPDRPLVTGPKNVSSDRGD